MADPIAACKQIRGDDMNKAMRKMPPVQGLSQPYTWPNSNRDGSQKPAGPTGSTHAVAKAKETT